MNIKNNMLTPQITPYLKYLDEINDDEIQIAINLLDSEELFRVEEYCYSIKENFSRKRLFLFICCLIDFREKK